MAAEQRIFSQDDTLRLLVDKSKESDEFYLKILRRTHLASPPVLIAAFTGAQIAHFTSPELWLPQLAGGGKFQMLGYHATDLNRPVGSYITFSVDSEDAREVDMNAAKKPGWRGPALLEYPKEADRARSNAADMPLYDVRPPPGPGSRDSATTPHAWPRQPGGGVHRETYDDAFGARAGALEAERRKLEAEKLEAERERHKAELAARDAAHRSEMSALKSELLSEIRQKPSGPDASQTMLLEFMKQQAEDRRVATQQAAEDRRAAETRAADERKAQREAQDRADARFEKVLEKISEKKGPDPLEMLEKAANIIGKKGNDNDAMVKSVHNMVEMQSSVMGMSMDFVDHVSRMQLGGGQEEPSWVKGIDRLMKGIGKMALARAPSGPVLAPAQQTVQSQAQPAQPTQTQTQPAPPPPPELSVVQQVEAAIRNHHDPVEVAAVLIKYYQDPSVQQALAEAGGDFEAAFLKRLGNWPEANQQNKAYLASLVKELEKQLQKAGYFADDAEPEDDAEGEEDAQVAEGDEADE